MSVENYPFLTNAVSQTLDSVSNLLALPATLTLEPLQKEGFVDFGATIPPMDGSTPQVSEALLVCPKNQIKGIRLVMATTADFGMTLDQAILILSYGPVVGNDIVPFRLQKFTVTQNGMQLNGLQSYNLASNYFSTEDWGLKLSMIRAPATPSSDPSIQMDVKGRIQVMV